MHILVEMRLLGKLRSEAMDCSLDLDDLVAQIWLA
jgi:hypothetical protein